MGPIVLAAALAAVAAAAPVVPAGEEPAPRRVLVELFTSQG